MIALTPRYLPETTQQRGRLDITGALTATLGVAALVFGTIHSTSAGWSAPATVTALAAGVALLIVLVTGEARAAQPIMPLRLFASRERVGGYLTRMLYMAAMMGFFFFTSQYMQEVLGFSALLAGLGFLPMTAVNFGVAMAIPRVTAWLGQAVPLAAGVALTFAGMLWLAQVGAASDYWTAVAAPMLLIGTGQGLVFAPVTSFGLAGVKGADAGAASGLVNTFHQLGSTLGLGVLVAASAGAGAGLTSAPAALTAHVHAALTVGSLILAIGLITVLALLLPSELRRRRHQRMSATVTGTGARPDFDPGSGTPVSPRPTASARNNTTARPASTTT